MPLMVILLLLLPALKLLPLLKLSLMLLLMLPCPNKLRYVAPAQASRCLFSSPLLATMMIYVASSRWLIVEFNYRDVDRRLASDRFWRRSQQNFSFFAELIDDRVDPCLSRFVNFIRRARYLVFFANARKTT